jgi:hypothetical protein
MRIPASALALGALIGLSGCATVDLPQPPRPGTIAAPAGGADGYQHGFEGSRFVVGDAARRSVQYGYLKQRGDSGTIAIKVSNGSAFGVPNAGSEYAASSRYAGSPDDHNAQVKSYFLALGLPPGQVADVRAMTLLQADGQLGEAAPAAPRILGYYSVVSRNVEGVPVPDSFAWARLNTEGKVVQEGIYWPPLPPAVIAEVRAFKTTLADPERRRTLMARVPTDAGTTALVIHHSSAEEDQLRAFASLDATMRTFLVTPGDNDKRQSIGSSKAGGTAVVHHYDINGNEQFLPQERLDLREQYPETKAAAR